MQVPITTATTEMTSLNRVRWTHSGHQIAAGDDDGKVYIYDVGEVSVFVILHLPHTVWAWFTERKNSKKPFVSLLNLYCQ